jgi:hypothetical protein
MLLLFKFPYFYLESQSFKELICSIRHCIIEFHDDKESEELYSLETLLVGQYHEISLCFYLQILPIYLQLKSVVFYKNEFDDLYKWHDLEN